MIAEVYLLGWKKSSLHHLRYNFSKSDFMDVTLFLLVYTSLVVLLAELFAFGLKVVLFSRMLPYFKHDLLGKYLANYPLIHFALYILIVDFLNYWVHRWMHENDWLWHIHKLHHSAQHFNVITSLRDHPVERLINSIVLAIPLAVLGVPKEHYIVFSVIILAVGPLKHSRILSDWGVVGKYLFQSSMDHWRHHAKEAKYYNTNYASLFTFWDKLFGTYYYGKDVNKEIGIDDDNISNAGFVKALLICYFDSLISLGKTIRRKFNPVKAKKS